MLPDLFNAVSWVLEIILILLLIRQHYLSKHTDNTNPQSEDTNKSEGINKSKANYTLKVSRPASFSVTLPDNTSTGYGANAETIDGTSNATSVDTSNATSNATSEDIQQEPLQEPVEYVTRQEGVKPYLGYSDTHLNDFIVLEFKATEDDEMEFKIILRRR